MRLIRFLFWIAATVTLAYFMTDFEIGGRTIKGQIDHFLRSEEGGDLKGKIRKMAEKAIASILGKDDLNTPLPEAPSEEIRAGEVKKLEELLKSQ